MFSQQHTQSWGCPLIHLRIFVGHVTIFISSPMQHLRWSSLWQKMEITGNCCCCCCCYRELCLKCYRAPKVHINLDEGNKVFHLTFTCSEQKKNPSKTICPIYSKLTLKIPKWCLVLLLLTLNIFHTLYF